MKRSFLMILCALTVLSFSSCGDNDSTPTSSVPKNSNETSIIGVEPSNNIDNTVPERALKEIEVSAPEGSISFEAAVQQLQRCLSSDLYLPDTPTAYKAFYAETTTINDMECYRIDLYLQDEDGTFFFVGVPYAVSCDGKYVFVKTIVGDYIPVQPVDEDEQKDYNALYENVTLSPADAIKEVNNVISEFNLNNNISDYYLRFDKNLYEVMDKSCYRIVITGYTSNSLQMAAFAFVSVTDGMVYAIDPSDSTQYIALTEK